ncbi:hypothetical protein HNP55_004155 [Paucibacter oligotrophus]|uniref:Uncharacterized protein n=1 Tax=Roseateles oligotrophus TaxID=1769250 RepID=A0A840LG54_9BURK|nr:hypothetical protein [Roseateles oligotrophus]MBB4845603.1 hypothetical protein [Roseateles oligotrophus]
MALRLIFWTALLSLALGYHWRYGKPAPSQPVPQIEVQAAKPFVFNNGSRRDDEPAPPASPAAQPKRVAKTAEPAPGTLRKCAMGKEVSYTSMNCPSGFTNTQITGGTINVVDGPAPALREQANDAGS